MKDTRERPSREFSGAGPTHMAEAPAQRVGDAMWGLGPSMLVSHESEARGGLRRFSLCG